MFGTRHGDRWGRPRSDRRAGPSLRGLLKVLAVVVAATVVVTALLPGLGVVIAVVFWLVVAAGLGAVAVPAARWLAPHARPVWAWLATALGSALGPVAASGVGSRWRRGVAWWRVLWVQARMWTSRTRYAWRRPGEPGQRGQAALGRGPRALPPGTSAARAESRYWS